MVFFDDDDRRRDVFRFLRSSFLGAQVSVYRISSFPRERAVKSFALAMAL